MKENQGWINKIPGEALLLLTAIIWGSGFVAQRQAMEVMQPFAFVALRFFLGCLVLLPALIVSKKKESGEVSLKERIMPGLISGLFLFAGTSFQQIGIVTTSASKAGFLTSLYLVLVPVIGLLFGKKANR